MMEGSRTGSVQIMMDPEPQHFKQH